MTRTPAGLAALRSGWEADLVPLAALTRRSTPTELDQALTAVRDGGVRRTMAHFRAGRSAQAFAAALPRAQVAALAPEVACRPGCSACCHQDIPATVPEVLNLAGYLQAHLRPAALEQLRATIAERAAAIRQAPSRKARWQKRLPCGLLGEGGLCRGHKHRPIECAGYTSYDADACARGGTIPADAVQGHAGAAVAATTCIGLDLLGREARPLELTLGLEIALSAPDAEARWQRGEAVFAAAHLRESPEWDVVHARLKAQGLLGAAAGGHP